MLKLASLSSIGPCPQGPWLVPVQGNDGVHQNVFAVGVFTLQVLAVSVRKCLGAILPPRCGWSLGRGMCRMRFPFCRLTVSTLLPLNDPPALIVLSTLRFDCAFAAIVFATRHNRSTDIVLPFIPALVSWKIGARD
jgi:hypothetical protein